MEFIFGKRIPEEVAHMSGFIMLLCMHVTGRDSPHHEDAQGPEAPAAGGWGPEPALIQVQAEGTGYQGNI